jgi:hypothetical protein
MHDEIKAYHESKTPDRQAICERLYKEIHTALPNAEHKIWHGAPTWFLDGNPIVGYHSLKAGMRLLFWSGQSFDEAGLKTEGTFKAAGVMYNDSEQVNSEDIQRWLHKSESIQWDYKNLMKNHRLVKIVK